MHKAILDNAGPYENELKGEKLRNADPIITRPLNVFFVTGSYFIRTDTTDSHTPWS